MFSGVVDQEVVKKFLVCLEITSPDDGWLVDTHEYRKMIPSQILKGTFYLDLGNIISCEDKNILLGMVINACLLREELIEVLPIVLSKGVTKDDDLICCI